MVGLPGLEPGTSPLSGVHSNQLSYRPEYCAVIIQMNFWSLKTKQVEELII